MIDLTDFRKIKFRINCPKCHFHARHDQRKPSYFGFIVIAWLMHQPVLLGYTPAFVLAIWIWNWVGSLQSQSRNGYVWYEVWNSQSRENSTFRVKIRSGFLEKKPYTLTTKLRLIVVAFKISFDFGFSDSFVLVFAFSYVSLISVVSIKSSSFQGWN